ncbi:hypothetical protein BGX34_000930 [Mortierella sp. NVP85]|nr:hypothetical protein BGX34_000930 [Mortierella sp. NVP85]
MEAIIISTVEKDQLANYFKKGKSTKGRKRQQTSPHAESSQQAADSTYRGTKSRKIELAKCFLDGPGEKSSDTSGDHLVLNGLDVTKKLMDHRKQLVADHADWAESDDVSKRLALNFIFERSFLEPIGICSDTLSKIFPERKLEAVTDADKDLLSTIAFFQHPVGPAFDTCEELLLDASKQTAETAKKYSVALQKRHMEWAGIIHIGIHNDWKNMPNERLKDANTMIGSTQAVIDAKEQAAAKQHRIDLATIANAIAGSQKKGRRNKKKNKNQNQPFPQGGAAKQQKN